MKNARLLLVDDEKDVREFLGYNLKKEGFEVFLAKNGREALKLAAEVRPHLIILDVMMPEMDGIETCAEMRRIEGLRNSLIVFLTARGEDYSQIAGFEAGGDDYVTKPVKPRVLVSRIKALLKRFREDEIPSTTLEFEGFSIDRERYIIIMEGEEINLPRKEFELLVALTSRPNKVFTREEIFSLVWGDNVVVGDRTIDVHIRKIREKTGITQIKTVKGVGYKFEY
ncbi:MAG: response regulator transcription factor [Bacteroidales bacterium]|nr:response regulator transcription factor [Bacteroidales bacterium]